MTEAGWLAGIDPCPMLEFVRGKASERKLRLFACACCRQVWRLFPDESCRQAVRVAELFADGSAPPKMRYSLKPVPDQNVEAITLNIDGHQSISVKGSAQVQQRKAKVLVTICRQNVGDLAQQFRPLDIGELAERRSAVSACKLKSGLKINALGRDARQLVPCNGIDEQFSGAQTFTPTTRNIIGQLHSRTSVDLFKARESC